MCDYSLSENQQTRCRDDRIGSRAARRGHRQATHPVALDQARDQAGGLRLLDEVAKQRGAGRVALRRADRLLYRGEAAVKDARAGQRLEVLQQARLEAGERVQPVGDELLCRGNRGFSARRSRACRALPRSPSTVVRSAALARGSCRQAVLGGISLYPGP